MTKSVSSHECYEYKEREPKLVVSLWLLSASDLPTFPTPFPSVLGFKYKVKAVWCCFLKRSINKQLISAIITILFTERGEAWLWNVLSRVDLYLSLSWSSEPGIGCTINCKLVIVKREWFFHKNHIWNNFILIQSQMKSPRNFHQFNDRNCHLEKVK